MEQIMTDEFILKLAHHILDNRSTIRATAKEFGLAKSTLHYHLSTRLKQINYQLYKEVKKLMDENFSVKHIHGGESTKHKYQQLKNEVNKFEETEALLGV